MRVYVDTSIFIDYLSIRGLAGTGLRSAGRRGRTLDQVLRDAEQVLERIAHQHAAATSALSYYEVEEALYKSLAAGTAGVAHADLYRVAAARSIVPQTVVAIRFFNIEVLELTSETVDAQLRTPELQTRAVRAADALHVATAARWNADVIVTADEDLLRLDEVLRNDAGGLMKCCDSDVALGLL
jgi:predicted nucleic acid-binding protein